MRRGPSRALFGVFILLAACTHEANHTDLGASADAAGLDGAVDLASASDQGMRTYTCSAPPVDVAACIADGDCRPVLRQCYCGQQPVDGVAVTYSEAANGCEAMAGATCTLGCATFEGYTAQDGQSTNDATRIKVRCEGALEAPGVCKTYVGA